MSHDRQLTSNLGAALRAAGLRTTKPGVDEREATPGSNAAGPSARLEHYSALSKAAPAADMVRCAVIAGRLGMDASPAVPQRRAMYAAIEELGRLLNDNGTSVSELGDYVLALACLCRRSR